MTPVEIVRYALLEKLLTQRLEELLVSLKRPDLKGQLAVKIVKKDGGPIP